MQVHRDSHEVGVRCDGPPVAATADDAFQVVRRVDGDGTCGRLDDADADAVLERAQLLERLGELERLGGSAASASSVSRR